MAEISKQLLDVVRRMDSGSSSEREAARLQLVQMGPLAVSHLVAELQRTPRVGKKISMLLIAAKIVLLPLLLVGVVISAILMLAAATDGAVSCLLDVGYLGDLFTGWDLRQQYHDRLHERQWNQIVRALAQLDDVRVAGPLAEALEVADATTRPAIQNALLHLLPQLLPSNVHALTQRQRQAFYALLRQSLPLQSGRDMALGLASLRMLVTADDGGALPVVTEAAHSAKSATLRDEAREGMARLQQAVEQQRVSQSLLRGSSAPATPSDMLLRPVQFGGTTAPQELLRAIPE